MNIYKISQTETTETSQSYQSSGSTQSIDQGSLDQEAGGYLNNFTQNFSTLAVQLDSATGELSRMVNDFIRNSDFNDQAKTKEHFIGTDGTGGEMGNILNKMTDVQNKFNKIKEFIMKNNLPVENKMLLKQQAEQQLQQTQQQLQQNQQESAEGTV